MSMFCGSQMVVRDERLLVVSGLLIVSTNLIVAIVSSVLIDEVS